MISIQAPQYQHYALITDFLDLANLSVQEEAALAKNWIKDRPEGLKLQNLAVATMTGPAVRFSGTYDCRCSGRHEQMRVFGLWPTIDPSRESTSNCKGFSRSYGCPSTSFFAEHALPVLNVASRHRRWKLLHLCGQR